jgi:hypothetical protein
VLRRIFGLKREKVAGGWRTLHNKELRNLYASPVVVVVVIRLIKSKMIRWEGQNEKCIQKFGQKTWRRPLRRPRQRWEDNIRMDLREIGWEGVDTIHLAQ